MAKNIDIGGRLHSVASGNVVAGANEILDDAEGKKQSTINAELRQAIIDSQINEAEATVDEGVGTPSAIAEVIGQKLSLAFQNIMGDGIASIQQTTMSEESDGINVFTVTTVGGKVGTLQVRNGHKGDTVILGEGQVYILYNSPGQNTDGAMTQKEVTDLFEGLNEKEEYADEDFETGGYYDLTYSSAPQSVTSASNLKNFKVKIKQGAIINIVTKGGANGRAYALTYEDLTIYDRAPASADYSAGKEVVAAHDGWLYVNSLSSFTPSVVIKYAIKNTVMALENKTKANDEKIETNKGYIDDIERRLGTSLFCECGAIQSTTGRDIDYATRARTKNYLQAPFSISTNSGFKISSLYTYSESGVFESSTSISSSNYNNESINDNKLYRLSFSKGNEESITSSDLENIVSAFAGSYKIILEKIGESEDTADSLAALAKKVETNIVETTLTIDSAEGGYLYGEGRVVESQTRGVTDYVPVSAFDRLIVKENAFSVSGTCPFIEFYKSKDATSYISYEVGDYGGRIITIPEDANYARFTLSDNTSPVVFALYNDREISISKTYLRSDFTDNIFYSVTGIYAPIQPTEASNFEAIRLKISKGDIIDLVCFGGNNGLAYALADDNLAIYDRAPGAADYRDGITIKAEKDGWLYVSNQKAQVSPTITIHYNRLSQAEHRIDTLEKAVVKSNFSISMFETIGACGGSSTSGAIFNGSTFIGEIEKISWGKVLGRMCGINVSVFAQGGTDTETFLTRETCMPALLDAQPLDLYVINLGTNDSTYLQLGTINDINDADYTQNPNTFYGNYGKIIEILKAHAPNAKIMLAKVFTNYPGARYDWSSEAIEEIADHYGIPYIETMDSKFLSSDWVNDCMRVNGGHLTAIGYSGLAKAMKELIEATMEKYDSYFLDYAN